ncbi:MAG: phasin family protein [Magnetococcales bacterium]|nr:phasin family protein [Magnetococcales bacterium]
MDNKIADQFTNFAKNMMDSMKELQAINEKTLQDLTNQQFKTAQDFISSSSEQMEQMSKAKTVEQAVSEQARITSSMGKLVLDNAQATMQVLTNGQKELESLINKAVKENMEKAGS